jgi:hypothetical protein
MIENSLLWDSEPGNDMVEEKTRCCVKNVAKCGHGFGPFGKIIYYHHDVIVSINGWRMESHEVYAPLTEGADCDEWV